MYIISNLLPYEIKQDSFLSDFFLILSDEPETLHVEIVWPQELDGWLRFPQILKKCFFPWFCLVRFYKEHQQWNKISLPHKTTRSKMIATMIRTVWTQNPSTENPKTLNIETQNAKKLS